MRMDLKIRNDIATKFVKITSQKKSYEQHFIPTFLLKKVVGFIMMCI